MPEVAVADVPPPIAAPELPSLLVSVPVLAVALIELTALIPPPAVVLTVEVVSVDVTPPAEVPLDPVVPPPETLDCAPVLAPSVLVPPAPPLPQRRSRLEHRNCGG
jgi:hypothetical protein